MLCLEKKPSYRITLITLLIPSFTAFLSWGVFGRCNIGCRDTTNLPSPQVPREFFVQQEPDSYDSPTHTPQKLLIFQQEPLSTEPEMVGAPREQNINVCARVCECIGTHTRIVCQAPKFILCSSVHGAGSASGSRTELRVKTVHSVTTRTFQTSGSGGSEGRNVWPGEEGNALCREWH